MPTFSNLSQLGKYLQKVVRDSMEDVGVAVEDKVREKIEEVVYNNPAQPNEYIRTHELATSLIHTQPKQTGNEITVEVKHEDDLIGHYAPNQHMSVVDGSELSVESLAEIVNYGLAGDIFGQGYWTESRSYFSDAEKEVLDSKLHLKAMKDSLHSKGIKTL